MGIGTLEKEWHGCLSPTAAAPRRRPCNTLSEAKLSFLIDEMSSSDAELFAAGSKPMKLGKVIGARSWGGAVDFLWQPGVFLSRRRLFYYPSFGPYLGNEWLIEQKGVVPDIPVANLPVESFHGTDKQLDAAIREVLKEIKASPDVKIPEHPQFPSERTTTRSVWRTNEKKPSCECNRSGKEKQLYIYT